MASPSSNNSVADFAARIAASSAQITNINTSPPSNQQLDALGIKDLESRLKVLFPTDRAKFYSLVHAGLKQASSDFLAGCEIHYMNADNKSRHGAGGVGNHPFTNLIDKDFKAPVISTVVDNELNKFITVDAEMIAMKLKARHLSQLDYPVLITGPTGTGKELIARALGAQSGSRTTPMVSINCAGLPESLIESELFGHVRGAFTGAIVDKIGLFKKATNGTIFLDEFGELSMNMQAKLLRAIQEKSIRKVGSNDSEPINCRILVATNRDLVAEYKAGKFREDLYWRVATFVMRTKGLKDRREDIPLIIDALDHTRTTAPHAGKFPRAQEFTDDQLSGNVRSIEAYVRRFQVFGELDFTY